MKKHKLLINLSIASVAAVTIIAPAFFAFSCSSKDDSSNSDNNPSNPTPLETISIPENEINNIKTIISNINQEGTTNQDLLTKIKAQDPVLNKYIENIDIHYNNNAAYKSASGSIILSSKYKYKITNNLPNISVVGNKINFNSILTKINNLYVSNIDAPSTINLKPGQSIDLNVTIKKIDELNKLYPNWTGSWAKDRQPLLSNDDFYIDGTKNKHLQIVSAKDQVKGIYQYIINLNDSTHSQYWSNEFNVNYLEPNSIPSPNPKYNNFYNDAYSAIGTYYEKIINSNVPRPVNVDMYQTELWTKYHDGYGFIYPGWNRNYEIGGNAFFYKQDNTADYINAKDLVFREHIPGNENIKYNNANWILNEIKNGTFKKHPAADNFYESNISDLPAVEKEFIISTINAGPTNLGLYVPPGEVVTIEFDQETYDYIQATKWNSMRFIVNQNFWDNYNGSNTGGISNRYPFIRSEFSISNIDPQTRTLKIGSPFGGGLNIFINDPLSNRNINGNFNEYSHPVKFKVTGALQCVHYIDGYTSENNWKNQINLFKQQKLAPVLQGDSAYFALSIPSTGIDEFGHANVNDFYYPKLNFKKWNDYLFLSNYYNGRDLKNNNIIKLNMEFCDDIWDGACAWGGGNTTYCPTSSGVNPLFVYNPIESINPVGSWLMLHEINHNFEENETFFSKRNHFDTHQIILFNLSVIGDVGRYRNEMNYNGEGDFKVDKINRLTWKEHLDNQYITITDTLKANATDEYSLYANLLYTMGPKNYVDYVRWDAAHHSSKMPNWNGLEEIRMLSETFKLNFWPTFELYGKWWNDSWPSSYQNATVEQKAIIDKLSKYPAFDFVANLYAAGNYIYNSQNKTYVYGGDTSAPFEIIAGQPKEFDLNKFIISTNQNFKWNNLEFPSTSYLGANITYNPKTKILTYNPKIENIGKTDEFDITIHPSNFLNKSANYVPGYKFKIKVKNIANCGTVESYNLPKFGTIQDLHNDNNPTMTVPYTRNGQYIFTNNTNNAARKVKFQFVAPETANYEFLAKWDDIYHLYVNDQKVYSSSFYHPDFTKVYKVHLNKGQTLSFDNEILNLTDNGAFEMIVKSDINPKINLFDNIVLDDLKTLNSSLTINQILNQKYVPRSINYTVYNSTLSKFDNETTHIFPVIDSKRYKLSSPTPEATNTVENLNNYDSTWCEVWNEINGPKSAKLVIDMNTVNNQRINIRSILIGCRYNNHWNARPSNIEIKINDENNNMVTVYNGEFPTRQANFSYINLDKTYNTNKVQINMVNNYQNGISLWYLNFASNIYIPRSNSIAFNNSSMNFSNNWTMSYNNEQNVSALNDCFLTTNQENASVEFTLNNIQGFDIIGQDNNLNAGFDVYINDKLYQHVNVNGPKRKDNANLFSYHQDNPGLVKVKIVSTTNKKLFLNYVMTYGKNTSII